MARATKPKKQPKVETFAFDDNLTKPFDIATLRGGSRAFSYGLNGEGRWVCFSFVIEPNGTIADFLQHYETEPELEDIQQTVRKVLGQEWGVRY